MPPRIDPVNYLVNDCLVPEHFHFPQAQIERRIISELTVNRHDFPQLANLVS